MRLSFGANLPGVSALFIFSTIVGLNAASGAGQSNGPFVDFNGTGGTLARCAPDRKSRVPLSEQSPGLYRGTLPIEDSHVLDILVEFDHNRSATSTVRILGHKNALAGTARLSSDNLRSETFTGSLSMRGTTYDSACQGTLTAFIPADPIDESDGTVTSQPSQPETKTSVPTVQVTQEPVSKEASEREGWLLASAINTSASYLDFLLKYPNGRYRELAIHKLEALGGLRAALDGAAPFRQSENATPNAQTGPTASIRETTKPPKVAEETKGPLPPSERDDDVATKNETSTTALDDKSGTCLTCRTWSLAGVITEGTFQSYVPFCETGMRISGELHAEQDRVKGTIWDARDRAYAVKGVVKGNTVVFNYLNEVEMRGSTAPGTKPGKIFKTSTYTARCEGKFRLSEPSENATPPKAG